MVILCSCSITNCQDKLDSFTKALDLFASSWDNFFPPPFSSVVLIPDLWEPVFWEKLRQASECFCQWLKALYHFFAVENLPVHHVHLLPICNILQLRMLCNRAWYFEFLDSRGSGGALWCRRRISTALGDFNSGESSEKGDWSDKMPCAL